jgi:hypothetical protein
MIGAVPRWLQGVNTHEDLRRAQAAGIGRAGGLIRGELPRGLAESESAEPLGSDEMAPNHPVQRGSPHVAAELAGAAKAGITKTR